MTDKILFLCHNEDHARIVRETLEIPDALYLSWQSPRTGHRFQKIVWMGGEPDPREYRFLREIAPTLLAPGGTLVVL